MLTIRRLVKLLEALTPLDRAVFAVGFLSCLYLLLLALWLLLHL